MSEDFFYNVYAVVEEIPKGKVATYHTIAKKVGKPQHARLVGSALKWAHLYGDFPCHRVVHSDGSLVRGWDEQYDLLLAEEVSFNENQKVDMTKCLWK